MHHLSAQYQIRPNMCPALKYAAYQSYQLRPDCLDGPVGGVEKYLISICTYVSWTGAFVIRGAQKCLILAVQGHYMCVRVSESLTKMAMISGSQLSQL